MSEDIGEVWLFEQGDTFAHLFPEDDECEKAICGYWISGECGECGHTLEVRPMKEHDTKCPRCLTAIQSRARVTELPGEETKR